MLEVATLEELNEVEQPLIRQPNKPDKAQYECFLTGRKYAIKNQTVWVNDGNGWSLSAYRSYMELREAMAFLRDI